MKLLDGHLIVERVGPDAPFAHRLAIAIAGRVAADLGARVVKVVPPGGDPLSTFAVLPHEESGAPAALSAVANASKTLLTLDTDTPAGRAACDTLLAQAAGLLTDAHGPAPAAGSKRVDVAVRVLPDTVGMPPPATSELTVLAMSGMLDLIGDPGRSPLALGGHQVAYASGYTAFTALVGGLASHRARRLDVDLLDVMMWINWKGVATPKFRPGASLSREGSHAEWQILPCADGHIALVHSEKDWVPLTKLIGHPGLEDPGLLTLLGREKRRAQYIPIIKAWAATRNREEIYRAAQARGVPIGPVVLPGDFASDPQLAARESIARFDGSNGPVELPRLPLRWNGTSFQPRAPIHARTVEEALR